MAPDTKASANWHDDHIWITKNPMGGYWSVSVPMDTGHHFPSVPFDSYKAAVEAVVKYVAFYKGTLQEPPC